ncbi:hypothetical protein EI94DRAFT_1737439 [Lactarius quietus]|nr:hypothetical protein EI94DRAFT_1737439 [Lactarius quietus]
MLRASKLPFITMMHTPHFPLSRFRGQVVVTVLLAIVSLTSAEAEVKEYVAMYPDWKCGDCWSDSNPTVRALNTEASVPGGLNNASVENCIGECKSMNFNIAGLEQNSCWCGDQLTPGSGSENMLMSNCLTTCTGDSTEFCGGNSALLVYYTV